MSIKCPSCKESFGYLKLETLSKVGNHLEFNCPSCQIKLNDIPVKKVSNLMTIYFVGAAIFLMLGVCFENYIANTILGIPSVYITIGGTLTLMVFGYLKMKKLDVGTYYGEVN